MLYSYVSPIAAACATCVVSTAVVISRLTYFLCLFTGASVLLGCSAVVLALALAGFRSTARCTLLPTALQASLPWPVRKVVILVALGLQSYISILDDFASSKTGLPLLSMAASIVSNRASHRSLQPIDANKASNGGVRVPSEVIIPSRPPVRRRALTETRQREVPAMTVESVHDVACSVATQLPGASAVEQ
jgi:hypothetical protein